MAEAIIGIALNAALSLSSFRINYNSIKANKTKDIQQKEKEWRRLKVELKSKNDEILKIRGNIDKEILRQIKGVQHNEKVFGETKLINLNTGKLNDALKELDKASQSVSTLIREIDIEMRELAQMKKK